MIAFDFFWWILTSLLRQNRRYDFSACLTRKGRLFASLFLALLMLKCIERHKFALPSVFLSKSFDVDRFSCFVYVATNKWSLLISFGESSRPCYSKTDAMISVPVWHGSYPPTHPPIHPHTQPPTYHPHTHPTHPSNYPLIGSRGAAEGQQRGSKGAAEGQ